MIELGLAQYGLLITVYAFSIIAFAAAALWLFVQRSEVVSEHRGPVMMTAMICAVGAYSYYHVLNNFEGSYLITQQGVKATAQRFDDAFRYSDWLLTVPLQIIVLTNVVGLTRLEARSKSITLGTLAAVMILIGYLGQVMADSTARWFGLLGGMIPFLIIVQQLFVSLSDTIEEQSKSVRGLIKTLRAMTVLVWLFYPVAYVLPLLNVGGRNAFVAGQAGYSVADLLSKALFGLLVLTIAQRRSREVGVGNGRDVVEPVRDGAVRLRG